MSQDSDKPVVLGVDLDNLVWDVRLHDFWETTRKFLNDQAVKTEYQRHRRQAANMREAQRMICGGTSD